MDHRQEFTGTSNCPPAAFLEQPRDDFQLDRRLALWRGADGTEVPYAGSAHTITFFCEQFWGRAARASWTHFQSLRALVIYERVFAPPDTHSVPRGPSQPTPKSENEIPSLTIALGPRGGSGARLAMHRAAIRDSLEIRPHRSLQLLAPVAAHPFAVRQDVPFHRSFQFFLAGYGLEIERGIQSKQFEIVAMWFARRRAGAVVAGLAEIV